MITCLHLVYCCSSCKFKKIQIIFFREDEDDVTAFPVVKESGDRLLETGVRTLQKTLLLKKEVEVAKVDADLEEARRRFRERMEECAQRRIHIQKRRQEVRPLTCFFNLLKLNCIML